MRRWTFKDLQTSPGRPGISQSRFLPKTKRKKTLNFLEFFCAILGEISQNWSYFDQKWFFLYFILVCLFPFVPTCFFLCCTSVDSWLDINFRCGGTKPQIAVAFKRLILTSFLCLLLNLCWIIALLPTRHFFTDTQEENHVKSVVRASLISTESFQPQQKKANELFSFYFTKFNLSWEKLRHAFEQMQGSTVIVQWGIASNEQMRYSIYTVYINTHNCWLLGFKSHVTSNVAPNALSPIQRVDTF